MSLPDFHVIAKPIGLICQLPEPSMTDLWYLLKQKRSAVTCALCLDCAWRCRLWRFERFCRLWNQQRTSLQQRL